MSIFQRFGFFIFLIIVCFGTFCSVDLYRTLNIKNVVLGYFQSNSGIENISDFEYKITNLLWSNSGDDENTYFAKITTNAVNISDKSKTWKIAVNGEATNTINNSYAFVNSIFTCEFLSEQNETILIDAINIKVSFCNDETVLIFITKNGEKATKLWSSYIEKFGMKINVIEDIKTTEEVEPSIDISAYENETKYIELYIDNILVDTIEYNLLTYMDVKFPNKLNNKVITEWKSYDTQKRYGTPLGITHFSFSDYISNPKTLSLYAVVSNSTFTC